MFPLPATGDFYRYCLLLHCYYQVGMYIYMYTYTLTCLYLSFFVFVVKIIVKIQVLLDYLKFPIFIFKSWLSQEPIFHSVTK